MARLEAQPNTTRNSQLPVTWIEDVDWGVHREWRWNNQCCHWRHLGDPEHPALLLLHGFAAGSGHWRRNAQELAAAGWSVYALDLIGFGGSSQPGSLRLDNRFWARQVACFLREVIGKPTVLVGHSLGGLVALTCSVLVPPLVRGVIAAPLPDPTLLMVSAKEGPWRSRLKPWQRRLKRMVIELLCRLLPLELIIPVLAHSPLLALGIQAAYLEPVIGDQDLHRVVAHPARRPGAVHSLRSMSIGMAIRPRGATAPNLLQRLCVPMLLIWGEQDILVPLTVGLQCQKLRKDLPLTVVPGAGHCPHDEKAELFNRVVINWLKSLSIPI